MSSAMTILPNFYSKPKKWPKMSIKPAFFISILQSVKVNGMTEPEQNLIVLRKIGTYLYSDLLWLWMGHSLSI